MKYIISCSDDKTIRVLDIKVRYFLGDLVCNGFVSLQEGRCMRTISEAHSHFVSTISMSANYPMLVSGSVDKNVCLWHCS